ncbi:zinc finger protein 69 homolog [Agrilus planipennis]|uniref:Zinc finger protein 69 homolog n=1 Tax=Agrilus planipennis TaxID=224129 RepID=A0A1W4X2W3_AGRPL|nr:zinc finger protein 69 homolog [Agrilus planipennis]
MTQKVNICRFCLSESNSVLQILRSEHNIAEKVEQLTSIKILSNDKLPKTSCLKCIENINRAYKIRQNIIIAHRCLQQKYYQICRNAVRNSSPQQECINKSSIKSPNAPEKPAIQVGKINPSNQSNITESGDSTLDSPFETVFLPRVSKGENEVTINIDEITEAEEQRIIKKAGSIADVVKQSEKHKFIQQRLHQQKLQQYHLRLLQQQRIHLARIQLQQQRLQKLPLTQQKRQLELQRLQQLQRQKFNIQQKQRQISAALKQTFNTPSNKVEKSSPLPQKAPLLPRKCEVCVETFDDDYAYKLHMKKHQSKTCDLCNVTIRADNFKKHMDNVHKDEPAVCEVCGKVAKNKESLRGHMYYIHLNRKTFQCEHCNKYFQSKHGYLHHLKKTHLGIRNQQCDICGKKFYSNYDLKKHINMTHKGSRPHICPYCSKGFSSTNARKVHMRQHTLETPYKCEECGGGFRQKVSLKTHMKSKHNLDLKEVEATQIKLSSEEVKVEEETVWKKDYSSDSK